MVINGYKHRTDVIDENIVNGHSVSAEDVSGKILNHSEPSNKPSNVSGEIVSHANPDENKQ